ncbi:unnamed protein product [Schistosoma curassoni]|uniref:KH_dom_type_1 domain-containing protein n=1 Tax=Schistosoma curassoni TaxID=6186 RepID=A0A183JQS6_9TREM|nr:unnamed protein product [Schistosoma curassoni]
MAIRQIKIEKAAKPHNIPAEALKSEIGVSANMFHVRFNKIVGKQGGSDVDVNTTTGKARAASMQLKDICNSKQLSANVKVKISSTNVETVLCGVET